jgi:NADP-dependent 3-hydroxy acid dehydrogenase YdfG
MDIKGSVIVVTGASSGIGEATARAAAALGARLALLARRTERIQAIASELHDAQALTCDVTRPEQVKQAVDDILSRYGRIDVLVNNAGQGLHARVDDIGIDDFRALLDLNTIAPLVMMQAVLPSMRRQGAGSIVNVSSGATLATYPGSAAYTSSKAALNMLTDVARLELADAGIVVSNVLPFVTATDFYGAVKSGKAAATSQEAETASIAHSPHRVAEVILDLIRSGKAAADLVPNTFGGSCDG